MMTFKPEYMDETQLNKAIIERFHGGYRCPYCETALPAKHHPRFISGGRMRCGACEQFFTYRTLTPFSRSKLSSAELVMLESLLTVGVDAKYIAALLNITIDTVLDWKTKFAVLHV